MHRNRYVVLLGVLIFFHLALPALHLFVPAHHYFVAEALVIALVVVLIFGMIFAVSQKPSVRTTAIVLAVPVLVARGIDIVAPSTVLDAIAMLCMVAILFLVIVSGLRLLFRPLAVTINIISASLCAYLLMATLWAYLYALVDLFLPGSFAYSLNDDFTMSMNDGHAFYASYFSYVTITTLGYGDILPVSPPAMALATLEAFVGQMYIAVLVARLVAVYSTRVTEPADSDDRGQ